MPVVPSFDVILSCDSIRPRDAPPGSRAGGAEGIQRVENGRPLVAGRIVDTPPAEGMSSKAAVPVIANVRSSIEFASDWVKVVPGGE